MNKLSGAHPADATRYLAGLEWPAMKDQVADKVRSNGAPGVMVAQILNCSTEQFYGPQDLAPALKGYPRSPQTTLAANRGKERGR